MANQIVVSAGAKVRNLSGVLTATSGVVSFLPIDVSLGIPQLDVNGKILVSQLPNSVMEYKGTWSAATNTPTLANGTGNQGDVYLCNVAGTVDFGAGPIAFVVGDQVIYSGSIWQRASGATGTVTSVAVTESGDSLNITGSPITTSGTINIGFNGTNLQYVNGAGNLTTFPILTGYVTAVSGTAPVVSSGGTTPAISMAAATGSVDGYLLATDFAIFSAKQSALTFSSPLVNTSGTISIPAATTSVNGYLASADFTTFNNKQNAITLTTTGSSGVSTLVGATLNIPDYGSALTGYVTLATTQTITGAKTFSGYTTFTSTVDITSGLTFSNSGFTLLLQPPTLSVNRTVTLPNATGTLALTSDISYPVSSVFGRTGAVVATNGDYTTAQVTEVTNLYYTDTRARLALSFAAGSGAYNSTTGIITIPTNNNQITNGAGYITGNQTITLSGDVSGSGTTAITTTIGALKVTNAMLAGSIDLTTKVTGLLPDGNISSAATWNAKQNAITLTTTGTSGAATLVGATLNIPQYQGVLTNPVTGTGTTNYLPKFTGTSTIGNSLIQDDGTTVSIIRTAGDLELSLWAGSTTVAGNSILGLYAGTGAGNLVPYGTIKVIPETAATNTRAANMLFSTRNSAGTLTESFRIFSTQNVGIGTGASDSGYKLDVNGTGRFSGNLLTTASQVDITLNATSTSQYSRLIFQENGTEKGGMEYINSAFGTTARRNKLEIFNSGGIHFVTQGVFSAPDLSITSTGAATFSSTVTATQFTSGGGRGTSYGYQLPDWQIYNKTSGNALAISNYTTDCLTLASTGAATFSSTLGIGGVADSVKSGTYTPTINTTTNIASSSVGTWQYLRVGNTVTVSGSITITPTSGVTTTSFNFSLPINSTFATGNDCAGTGVDYNATTYLMVNGNSGAANFGLGLFKSTTTSTMTLSIQFTYQII